MEKIIEHNGKTYKVKESDFIDFLEKNNIINMTVHDLKDGDECYIIDFYGKPGKIKYIKGASAKLDLELELGLVSLTIYECRKLINELKTNAIMKKYNSTYNQAMMLDVPNVYYIDYGYIKEIDVHEMLYYNNVNVFNTKENAQKALDEINKLNNE